jgi:hypothetical protein
MGEKMSDCLFCGTFVGEETHDGGCKGRTIGNRDVCEQCLSELKYILDLTTPKSPSLRENKVPLDEDDDFKENESESNSIEEQVEEELNEDEADPFTASPKN